jgi:hypothetical protein
MILPQVQCINGRCLLKKHACSKMNLRSKLKNLIIGARGEENIKFLEN